MHKFAEISKKILNLKNVVASGDYGYWNEKTAFYGIFIFIDEYYAELYYVINDCYYTVVKYEMCH